LIYATRRSPLGGIIHGEVLQISYTFKYLFNTKKINVRLSPQPPLARA
jgi:hypothetical protein